MFCDSCDRNSYPVQKNKTREISIRGVSVAVDYKANICPYCGEEFFDEDIEAQLLKDANEAYKKAFQLLATSSLLSWMKKNAISREVLARKLECSVTDIVRCTCGGIQSEELDKKLRSVIFKSA